MRVFSAAKAKLVWGTCLCKARHGYFKSRSSVGGEDHDCSKSATARMLPLRQSGEVWGKLLPALSLLGVL